MKRDVVADHGDADHSGAVVVLVVDFRDGDVEPALEPADDALDDAPLGLERPDPLHVYLSGHGAD